MQRYKFESNSQLFPRTSIFVSSCVYLCKDTNLKAIHNDNSPFQGGYRVVFTYAKIQIWKQFTTVQYNAITQRMLCLPMQRYKFESNSQLTFWGVLLVKVVFTYAKIQIWKQFTTISWRKIKFNKLCLPMQRYKFESNSQLLPTDWATARSCVYLCKDTNLKAIHNSDVGYSCGRCVVFTYAKIQIWKQFTTDVVVNKLEEALCLPMQRYKFESNSQLRPHR